ncbi:Uncharacterised protein [Mycobacteroides abscessus subsp. abscessus]|nr:Uncharacterised protein [Mycobacteroides abscessus subsp. abscessus]
MAAASKSTSGNASLARPATRLANRAISAPLAFMVSFIDTSPRNRSCAHVTARFIAGMCL